MRIDFPTLAPRPYRPSFPEGLLDYILCPRRTASGEFYLVVQHLLVCVKVSRGEHRIWVRPYLPTVSSMFCSLTLDDFRDGRQVAYSYCFVGCCFKELLNIAHSLLMQLTSIFFSQYACSASMWCIHAVVWTRPLHVKMRFIWSDWSDHLMTDNLSIAARVFAYRAIDVVFRGGDAALEVCELIL